jgi:predicted site-specific integrase-resolvase
MFRMTTKSSLHDTASAAAFLGVAPITLSTWRSTGRYGLPYIKTGRSVRYRQSDLEAFQERMTRTQTE